MSRELPPERTIRDRESAATRRRRALTPQAEGATAPRQLNLRDTVAPYVRSQRGKITLLSIAAIIGGFAEAGLLVLIARISFAVASNHSSITIEFGPIPSTQISVEVLVTVAAALVVLRAALQVAQSVLQARATASVVNSSCKRLIRLYLGASWDLQSAQQEGRLQQLVTSFAFQTSSAVSAVAQGLIASFNLAALLVAALVINAVASIAAGLAALLIGLILRPLRAALRRRSRGTAAADLRLATGVTELTATLQEVHIFGAKPAVVERLDNLTDASSTSMLRTLYVGGAIPVVYQAIAMGFIVGALAVSYQLGGTKLASLGAVVLILLRSLSYAQNLQGSVQSLHQTAPYLETLSDEEQRYEAAALRLDGEPVDRIGTLAFEHVTFEYEPGIPALHDVSFTVQPGEIIGIIGPSGAGKSTLVQLLLRLRDPSSGAITTDGRDVAELSIDGWYERMSFVPQEARLLSGTVEENIRFYRPDLSDADVESAARMAHIHDDIVGWSDGYRTPVGERGGQLSGGQRQRLCIARALAENPDVVVLDEPTSALDVKSEALMRDTIASLAPDTTVFVVAHRLSTLAVCDRIMVIMNGVLEGFDTPQALEASNPFYREALQLSGMR